MKEYKAKLIGEDGFEKNIVIREQLQTIFIPIFKPINCYIGQGEDILSDSRILKYRIFSIDNDSSYKKLLIYKEV